MCKRLSELAETTDSKSARVLHGNILPGAIYSSACRQHVAGLLGDVDLGASAVSYADDLIERMAPRDPAEEMLVVQMLMAHSRVMHLTSMANEQERLEPLRIVNEYADRASNTYRRLMLALTEYRKPPRSGDSFTAIRQANIAGQQVVMNDETPSNENTTNEQGCDNPDESFADAPILPAELRGPCIPAGKCAAGEAMATVNRASYARGEGAKPHERMETR